ncbi:MAG: hypothetical protein NUK65_13270, partial [Firmicutes bacterium]|nr:hypothetical protein [Bacillota bacterium]
IYASYFEGKYGAYEIIGTRLVESARLREEYIDFYGIIKFTNTTNEVIIPGQSIPRDIVLEQETEVELNEIVLEGRTYRGTYPDSEELSWVEENQEWKESASMNIRPGATVEVVVTAVIEKRLIDSTYLRDRNEQGENGLKFEKKMETLK